MKILMAKPGLDGHDVGVKVIAHALKENGYEVVYTGLRKTVEYIVDRAIQEKADVIGLSILSGTHQIICERMVEEMNKNKLSIPWFIGGNIPVQDVDSLEKMGATKAFPTGSTIDEVVKYIETIKQVA